VVGREVLAQQGLEGGRALRLLAAFFVLGAGLVGEMPRSGDGAVLERIGPGANLSGARFGEGDERGDFGSQRAQIRSTAGQREHRAHFAGGPARDVEEREQFVRRAALETFGDVVRDGQCGAFELVAEGMSQPRGRAVDEVVGPVVELGGRLPNGELFEAFVGRHRFFGDLRSEI
jgi:hypothetical protein